MVGEMKGVGDRGGKGGKGGHRSVVAAAAAVAASADSDSSSAAAARPEPSPRRPPARLYRRLYMAQPPSVRAGLGRAHPRPRPSPPGPAHVRLTALGSRGPDSSVTRPRGPGRLPGPEGWGWVGKGRGVRPSAPGPRWKWERGAGHKSRSGDEPPCLMVCGGRCFGSSPIPGSSGDSSTGRTHRRSATSPTPL